LRIELVIDADHPLRPRTTSVAPVLGREWNIVGKFSYSCNAATLLLGFGNPMADVEAWIETIL